MNAPYEQHMIIEEIQGHLYAWDKYSNEFLGQGATVEKLFERLQDDVPGGSTVVFRIAKEDGGQILYKRSLTEQNDGAIIDGEE